MLVSVIIATKNEERNIGNCLESIKNQDFPLAEIEVITVDNDSTDKTKEIARKYTEKVFNKEPERSAQRNLGVKHSSGKYILYLDADMILSREVIRECVEKMERGADLAGLYIPEKIVGSGFWGTIRDFERSFYNGTVIDAARFLRKDKFLKAGGFDETLYACEDWDLDKRLKALGKLGIAKNPLYHNETDFNLRKYLKKKKYYSKNINVYIEKWGKNDPDVKKQFGFYYRFFKVFTENGKWKKLLRHPILASGMYFLRFLVGMKFLTK